MKKFHITRAHRFWCFGRAFISKTFSLSYSLRQVFRYSISRTLLWTIFSLLHVIRSYSKTFMLENNQSLWRYSKFFISSHPTLQKDDGAIWYIFKSFERIRDIYQWDSSSPFSFRQTCLTGSGKMRIIWYLVSAKKSWKIYSWEYL